MSIHSTRPAKKGLEERSESVLLSAWSRDRYVCLVLTVVLEVLLARGAQLDGSQLVTTRRQ